MVELFANSGDPDQMLHSAASDQGLHCFVFMSSFVLVYTVCLGLLNIYCLIRYLVYDTTFWQKNVHKYWLIAWRTNPAG